MVFLYLSVMLFHETNSRFGNSVRSTAMFPQPLATSTNDNVPKERRKPVNHVVI